MDFPAKWIADDIKKRKKKDSPKKPHWEVKHRLPTQMRSTYKEHLYTYYCPKLCMQTDSGTYGKKTFDGKKCHACGYEAVSQGTEYRSEEVFAYETIVEYASKILKVKPNTVPSEDNLGNKINKRMIGIMLGPYNNKVNHVKLGPAKALYYSLNEVYFVTISTLKYLGSILTGSGDSSQLGGPIRIAKITGQVAEFGIVPFLSIMAYISISLGLINLFPIPMLDGGHLMFYFFEKILGRPLSQKTQEGFFRIGMFLLLSLMFFATFNDLKDIGLF